MAIRRPPLPADSFTIIPNAWMRDPRLSYRAKGLLAYIAGHAPGHELTMEQIIGEGAEGREAVRAAIRDLEVAGYLVRFPRRVDNRVAGTDFELRDPTAQKPVVSSEQHKCSDCAAQATAQEPVDRKPPPKKTTPLEDQKKTSTSFDAEASPNAGLIIKGFIDWLAQQDDPVKLTSSVIARLGREIKTCLKDGIDEGTVKRALVEMFRRGKAGWPSMLQSFVVEVQNRPVSAPPSAPRQPQFKNSEEQRIERSRIEQVRAELAEQAYEQGAGSVSRVEAWRAAKEIPDAEIIKLMTTSMVVGYSGGIVVDAEVVGPETLEVES